MIPEELIAAKPRPTRGRNEKDPMTLRFLHGLAGSPRGHQIRRFFGWRRRSPAGLRDAGHVVIAPDFDPYAVRSTFSMSSTRTEHTEKTEPQVSTPRARSFFVM